MAYALGRVPVVAEVDAFQRQVSGDRQLAAAR